MNLFYLDDLFKVQVNPELFTLKDFKDLQETRDVATLVKELGYLYHFCSLRSDFQFQINKEKRKEEVKRFVGLPLEWEPDEILKTCQKVYLYLNKTVAGEILETTYKMVDKIQQQIDSIDLNERHPVSNVPIWDLKKMVDTSKNIPELLEVLRKAESEYLKGQTENDKLRGDKLKTEFEDGFANVNFEEI